MVSTGRKLPTLEDVASAAGVSTATVSRCLNEPGKVSEKTRERVMQAVGKLNYSPNFGARAIAANRTGIFGAVIPTMENAIFARGIEAFQKSLVEKNATTLVASSAYDPEQEAQLIRTMVARGADGLLLIGTERRPEIYDFLSERNIPTVIAWACSSDTAQSYVGFDNRAASERLVAGAIRMGHRSFACISAPTSTNDRARDRVLGAQQAIAAAGFDVTAMQVFETNYSIDNGREAFRQIVGTGPLPSLVICGNDVLAVGAIQAAKVAGLDVPGDVSITGFDDIELATVISPALTTVHVPHRQMGQLAGDTLYSLVKDAEGPIRIELETRIVERESLAAPKKIISY
jgi:LacI family transcriptional regulator